MSFTAGVTRRLITRSEYLPAGSGRPLVDDFHGFGINHRNLVLVDEVDEDLTFAVGGEELGLASQLDCRIRLAGFGVDVR